MNPQTIDTQELKAALLQLAQSDKAFMQQLFQQTLLNITQEDIEKLDSIEIRKHLRDKYRHKGGVKMRVIKSLQKLFEDAPTAEEMANLLRK